ncbi:MAG: branched-chain amino acid aminotransferase [Oscillospiraceae bacterium]|nr:branched-chain amino acid aminotransferase [Oscillospiraceae bacterium]
MITIKLTENRKPKPPADGLGFGQYFTDHMFLYDYSPEKGWHDARVVPYAPLQLDPASMVFHYGQELFEGLKAYRGVDGKVRLFRAIENVRRLNRSCSRLHIPELDEQKVMEAFNTLVKTDIDWVPEAPDCSLYLRPFVIATDPFLGVCASRTYKFIVILSPVGSYYTGGIAPTRIFIEESDVRAVRGGTGEAKVGGNYAATMRAQENAKLDGFAQVLWLDAIERKYIEEIGTSNAFFIIDGTVITPPLSGTILPGITRRSVIELLKSWGERVEERLISIDEVVTAVKEKRLSEAFASGTAAVISPVGSFHYKGSEVPVRDDVGPMARKLYDTLTGIQWGKVEDTFGWTAVVGG